MIPTTFPEHNFVYTKPKGMTDEQCGDLPVHKGKDTYGNNVIVSCWKLSKEDIEEINQTGTLWILVAGQSMPPIIPSTENPFNPPQGNGDDEV